MIEELFFYKIGNFLPETVKNTKLVLNPFSLIDFTMQKKLLLLASFFIIISSFYASSAFSANPIVINGPPIYASVGAIKYCGNNATSCGKLGHCADLTGMVYCVRGRIVQAYCLSNDIKNNTLTSSCDGGDYNLNIRKSDGNKNSANITLYSAGSSKIIGKSSIEGNGVVNSLESTADMEFDLKGEFNFLMKNSNLEILKTSSNFLIDKINATIPGTTVFKTFYVELPQGFTFSSIVLKIKYSDVSINENNIILYKCSSFNTTGFCNVNWQKISTIKDSTKKMIIAEVNSFSAYALGDQGTNTTTTTTTIDSNSTSTTTTVSNSTTTTTATTTTAIIWDSGSGGDSSDYETTSQPTTTGQEDVTTVEETAVENTTLLSESNQTTEKNNTNPVTAFIAAPNSFAFIISAVFVGVGGLIFKMSKQDDSYKTKYYPGAAKFKKMKRQTKTKNKKSDFTLHL